MNNSIFETFFYDFVSKYEKEKISVVCAGAGFKFAEILSIPGASRVISGVYLPYATEETREFLVQNIGIERSEKFLQKTVSKESSELLFESLKIRNAALPNTVNIAITAAIQTNRHRRGENQAFITIEKEHKVETYNLKLAKLDEAFFEKPNPNSTIAETLRTQPYVFHELDRMRGYNDEDIVFASIMLQNSIGMSKYNNDFEEMKSNGSLRRL